MKIATAIINYVKSLVSKLIKLIVTPIKAFIKCLGKWIQVPISYISKKWHHFLYMNKLRYRQYKRKQYEQKSDKKVENYLKKSRT